MAINLLTYKKNAPLSRAFVHEMFFFKQVAQSLTEKYAYRGEL